MKVPMVPFLFQTSTVFNEPFEASQKQQINEDDNDSDDDEPDAADADAAAGIASGLLRSGLQSLTASRIGVPDDETLLDDQEGVQDRHEARSSLYAAGKTVSGVVIVNVVAIVVNVGIVAVNGVAIIVVIVVHRLVQSSRPERTDVRQNQTSRFSPQSKFKTRFRE